MAPTDDLRREIEQLWEQVEFPLDGREQAVIDEAMHLMDSGAIRCAELVDDAWIINTWVKKLLDLYYRNPLPERESNAGPMHFRDRFHLKAELERTGIRVAPPGAARYGSHFRPDVTLMSCYVHLGVWVGEGSLIDSWVTLGTCSQIGSRVKILPNTSVVGSLYPLSAAPTVIEDDCHIGSGCVVGPGVRVRRGAIVASGVTLSPATPIIDCASGDGKVLEEVPEDAIVTVGNFRSTALTGGLSMVGALILGYRDPKLTVNENLQRVISRVL